MEITCPDFENNEKIPIRFTGDGEDINPSLLFEDIPEDTKSLVLIMDDPDAPVGTWDHWLLFNLSIEAIEIKENSIPESAVVGRNSWGRTSYGGPNPPSGSHRYFFKLYAIDTMLDLSEGATKQELKSAIEGHVIAKAELVGLYR
ncbi:YbhB/YbcL family Raf kinase inhibitor-like protein [Candidatus Pacearchaeota archaeon]|nr:YbhB/YbcL family Raf kinase inhibitor-like protein [Candidatus Pacearchaeota archaeon]